MDNESQPIMIPLWLSRERKVAYYKGHRFEYSPIGPPVNDWVEMGYLCTYCNLHALFEYGTCEVSQGRIITRKPLVAE